MNESATPSKIYKKIRLTNSISVPHSGKVFEFSFTKKQYYLYLLSSIAWARVIKTILVIAGIVGLLIFKPLFLVCGVACLAIDIYAFSVKKINWYFIFAYPVGYLVLQSWYGLIFVSFLIGIANLIYRFSFSKMSFEMNFDKIQAQDKKVTRI